MNTEVEHCAVCGHETEHAVNVQVLRESDEDRDPGGFSREPYRVTECQRCGTVNERRMNNA